MKELKAKKQHLADETEHQKREINHVLSFIDICFLCILFSFAVLGHFVTVYKEIACKLKMLSNKLN